MLDTQTLRGHSQITTQTFAITWLHGASGSAESTSSMSESSWMNSRRARVCLVIPVLRFGTGTGLLELEACVEQTAKGRADDEEGLLPSG